MFKYVERLQLEHAVKIWSCCTKSNINNLEKVQLYAARIAIALSLIASITSINLYI